MKRESAVTIKDIADKLKVSPSTVSRALAGNPDININTRKKVADMAAELNYQPNLIAKSLRINRTNTIGVIVPELVLHFFSSCISGMQNACSERGFNIIICQSNENFEQEKINVNTLASSRVDGLLISLSTETNSFEHLEYLKSNKIPFVLFDRVSEDISVSKVVIDDEKSSFEATQHLIDQGYKNIAYINGPDNLFICRHRRIGYEQALRANGFEIKQENILQSDLSEASNIQCAHQILAMDPRPDAILAVNDIVAIDAIVNLKKHINIPEELGIVGFSNSPISKIVEPSLTTVDQPSYDMGFIAANHLLDKILDINEPSNEAFTLHTNLILRGSTAKSKVPA